MRGFVRLNRGTFPAGTPSAHEPHILVWSPDHGDLRVEVVRLISEDTEGPFNCKATKRETLYEVVGSGERFIVSDPSGFYLFGKRLTSTHSVEHWEVDGLENHRARLVAERLIAKHDSAADAEGEHSREREYHAGAAQALRELIQELGR